MTRLRSTAAARGDATAQWLASPWWLRSLSFAGVVAVLVLCGTSSNGGSSSRMQVVGEHKATTTTRDEDDHDDLHKIFHDTSQNRCLEDDDDEEERAMPGVSSCPCPDPFVPFQRETQTAQWLRHHKTQVDQINALSKSQVDDLDVVFLGDSITERWRGTATYGLRSVPEFGQVFDQHFNKTAGSSSQLQGLALGSSGDVTAETLWHLHHGFLADTLRPRVFQLLIGTNDLSRFRCSQKTTLVGILNVADALHHARPDTPIVFHGLLPRLDNGDKANNNNNNTQQEMGTHFWPKIMWINRELKRFCKLHKNWYYVDSAAVFLERDRETGHLRLKPNLMPDGLHPSVQGYQLWTAHVAANLQLLLQKTTTTTTATDDEDNGRLL